MANGSVSHGARAESTIVDEPIDGRQREQGEVRRNKVGRRGTGCVQSGSH